MRQSFYHIHGDRCQSRKGYPGCPQEGISPIRTLCSCQWCRVWLLQQQKSDAQDSSRQQTISQITLQPIKMPQISPQKLDKPRNNSAGCNPMNRSTPGLPVHHQLPEFAQTHIHRVSDAIQPSHPLSSIFPPSPSSTESIRLFYTPVSLLLSRTQGYCYHLSKFHIYVLV